MNEKSASSDTQRLDCKTVVFFANASDGVGPSSIERSRASKNGEGEWGETLKNKTVRHPYIKFVQNYPFFQQREIPIGVILTQSVIKCQSHLIKNIRKPNQFHWRDSNFRGKKDDC